MHDRLSYHAERMSGGARWCQMIGAAATDRKFRGPAERSHGRLTWTDGLHPAVLDGKRLLIFGLRRLLLRSLSPNVTATCKQGLA